MRTATVADEPEPAGEAKPEEKPDAKPEEKPAEAKPEKAEEPALVIRGLELPRDGEKPVLVYFHWPHEDGEKGKRVVNSTVIPAAGAVVGSAMSVWDAANDTRSRLASGRGLDFSAFKKPAPAPVKKGMGAGGVIAIILGVAAALGVLYAAWQTLRADDELWVADDPLRAPDA